MSAQHDEEDRGWYLHFREAERQFELCYRTAPGKWRKHRIARGDVRDEGDAERYAATWLRERERLGLLEAPAAEPQASPPTACETFGAFAGRWTSGKLNKLYPDHVRLKRSSDDDAIRVDVLSKAIGHVPLSAFTLEHAEKAMRQLDELRQARERERATAKGRKVRTLKPLSRASRRQYAQVLHRTLGLAVYPARVIGSHPLPRGFLPKGGGAKPLAYLYPDEDSKLLACSSIPLVLRVLFGFLDREGMREGEALGLRWCDLDLVRGAVVLDANKTDDPRAWALSPGVAKALKAWRERWRPNAKPSDPVFTLSDRETEEERAHTLSPFGIAGVFREHLRTAGVTRAELFDDKGGRKKIRVHDLRATFVTLSLANGKTEAWVASRTGHRSSVMINRYRRAAQKVEELGLGELKPLDEAIPEMQSTALTIVVQTEPPKSVATTNGFHEVRQLVADLVAARLAKVRKRRASRRNPSVARAGIEPATRGFSVRCSTN
jgi:integrase